MFEHVLLLIPICNSITVAWWHYTKTLTFIFFHKNSAEVHRQQDSPPQRKVKNKHVSGRKNVLGSLYSAEQTRLVVSAIQRCHTVINTLSESFKHVPWLSYTPTKKTNRLVGQHRWNFSQGSRSSTVLNLHCVFIASKRIVSTESGPIK